MRHVVISAMIDGYDGDTSDKEVWSVNRGYVKEDRVDRVYFFDHLAPNFDYVQKQGENALNRFNNLEMSPCPECGHVPEKGKAPDVLSFCDELNALDADIYTRKHYPEIPRSKPYPIQEILEKFGIRYFTCSVSYMIAHAIYEEVDKITLSGMYYPTDSWEYWHHLRCVEFWTGVAYGSGRDVEINGRSGVCKPYIWQPDLYGYVSQKNEPLVVATMKAAYMSCMQYPMKWEASDDAIELGLVSDDGEVAIPALSGEHDKLVEAET